MALLFRFCISRSDLTFQAVSWRGICGCSISSGLLTLKLSSLSMFGTFDIRDLCGLSHKTSSECVLGSVEESIQLDHDCNSTEESSTMQLVPPRSPEISGVCGHPIDNPRVGDEYQAEIPSMISQAEHLQLVTNPFGSDGISGPPHSFLIGLPVQIMWLDDHKTSSGEDEGCGSLSHARDAALKNESSKSKKCKKHCTVKKEVSDLNAELLDDVKELKPETFQSKVEGKENLDQLCKSKNYYPLPGLLHHPWRNADVDGFILGLYIFGKNLVQIQRFIDKEVGEILSFYYGKFYMSDAYRRWSDNRKTKRKKCVYGHRIFTGWRQQELFSRLDPHVPEHFRNTFQEVSMEFTKGKISLEDYVFKLKATVGIQFLVEAVGIGKGKNDLTGLAMEPVKNNPLFPDCPVGKDYCSLTASEIIKLLTGGFRLSKARSNDIFWEAVWPRLLARGWHSEQPMTQGYVDTNHYLVFLIPGIKKFSRGKLVKGNHYFDSVSDVLSKVASEPMLIELEAEETRGSICNEEDGWDPGEPSNLDDQPICQPRHFLKPQVSKRNLNHVKFTVVDSSRTPRIFLESTLDKSDLDALVMPLDGEKNMNDVDCNEGGTFHACSSNSAKFTIVDTSLLHGGISARQRELRCLPVEYGRASEMTNSTANETDFSESSLVQHAPDAPNRPNYRRGIFDKSYQDESTELKEHQSTRTLKHHSSRREKSSQSNYLVPPMKRQRLTVSSDTEMSGVIENFSGGMRSKQGGRENVGHQTPLLIDLNLPQAALYSNHGEPVPMEVENTQRINANNKCYPSQPDNINADITSTNADGNPAEEEPGMNPRRQSTRNRPMTIKALAALEYGFSEVKKKPKMRWSSHAQEILFQSPSSGPTTKYR
ncbi:PROTEIN putative-RELATED [Salix viminalis]|uniref:PROTEIN putative-RELATED n=1 Tax=Salix viminalis TaxID=40686 RepID=A0A9Q0UWP3_SALVM|nr:PROTEIN putative-RELATED [Salix viminalis]